MKNMRSRDAIAKSVIHPLVGVRIFLLRLSRCTIVKASTEKVTSYIYSRYVLLEYISRYQTSNLKVVPKPHSGSSLNKNERAG